MGMFKPGGDFTPHPPGIWPGFLAACELDESGDYGPRIKWQFDTTAKMDDGRPFRVNYWTSFSLHEKSNLPRVITALGFKSDDPYWTEIGDENDLSGSVQELFGAFGESRNVTLVIEASKKKDGSPSHKVANILPVTMAAPPPAAAPASGPAATKPKPAARPSGPAPAVTADNWED